MRKLRFREINQLIQDYKSRRQQNYDQNPALFPTSQCSHSWLLCPTSLTTGKDLFPEKCPASPVELPEVVSCRAAEQFKVWIQEFNIPAGNPGSDLEQYMLPLLYSIVFEFGYNLLIHINFIFLVYNSRSFVQCISTSFAYHHNQDKESPTYPCTPLQSIPTLISASGNQ